MRRALDQLKRKLDWLDEKSAVFFAFLSHVHPAKYLLIYILVVPAFAGIYCVLPEGFYAPNAQYEPIARGDRSALVGMLGDRLWNYFTCIDERVRNDGGVDGGWVFHPKELEISESKIEGTRLSFRTKVMLFKPDSPVAPLTLPIQAPFVYFDIPMKLPLIAMNPTEITYDKNDLAPLLSTFISQSPKECGRFLSRFSDEDGNKVRKYRSSFESDPVRISGSLGRMIYFSVVVITTLGFGDIVPMTGAARGWVAFEAMLGTVLIGLMLNAVAHRARAGSGNTTRSAATDSDSAGLHP